ncbi:rhamnogalacturonate lyase family protein [Actinidia rufa]|uniref:Rhamnogalacturonate lyase family protein n=1 Tax=Actinidia rufa TaxID=165716 RepID=A0A7J0FX09_9ERIC|nr:rhamnogalacturonate lyase family protein [Actinidia rufa]
MAQKNVTLITQGPYVILDNGLVKLTIAKPQGFLTGIKYGGMDNLLDLKSSESSRGYIVRSGVSGFHCYAVYERPSGCRAFDLAQTRMAFKLRRETFHYMAITDQKQRIMPMPEDLLPDRGKQLIVPESVLLVNPINPDLKGEVDDKYQYSMDNKDGGVHGWISSGPIVGFWIIFPSHEFRNGGPTKQNLTVHTGPNCLARLFEESLWPYDFVSSPYYLTAKERGSASGRLLVQDRFVSGSLVPAKNAYVGLSAARTEGVYGLHGWVPGFIGDYLNDELVTISSGSQTLLGNLVYSPVRNGPTVWEIGFPDRTATGFYVPDVNPMYSNKLFLNSPEKYRQYGMWDRYTDIHPESDQVFTIGINNPTKDWFFAHVDRRGANKYLPSTWKISFNLTSVTNGSYTLRLAIASATRSDLQVNVNYIDAQHLVFQMMNIGTDNTVCRHGIHGLYRLFSIDVSSSLLIEGDNSIFLTQARGGDALCGVLYDYIRLEAPVTSSRFQQ